MLQCDGSRSELHLVSFMFMFMRNKINRGHQADAYNTDTTRRISNEQRDLRNVFTQAIEALIRHATTAIHLQFSAPECPAFPQFNVDNESVL